MIEFISDKECIATLDTGEQVRLVIHRKDAVCVLCAVTTDNLYQYICESFKPYNVLPTLAYLHKNLPTTAKQAKLSKAAYYATYTYYPEKLL